jgi:ABC-type xylose transport system, permease component
MNNKISISEIVKKYTMFIVLAVIMIFFATQKNGAILFPSNINNLILQNAYVFILATGMLFCILTGGNIDLSVGSVVCLIGAIGGHLMLNMRVSPLLAIICMIVVGALVGAWQGFWIAYVRIPPFIVTLAGMLVFRGASNVVLDGKTLAPMPEEYLRMFNHYVPDFIGVEGINMTSMIIGIIACVIYVMVTFINRSKRGKKGYELEPLFGMLARTAVICAVLLFFTYKLSQYKGIPNVLIWVAVIVAIYYYISSKTIIGRHFYAVGGNEKATKLSGINTNRVYFLAYLNMGILSAIAAFVTIARLNSANPTAGMNYEMDAIASCFIGGASAYGGTGTVPGVIVGALLMGVINQGMTIMSVDSNYQRVVKGLVLLAAVIFDVVSKRKTFIAN